MKYTCVLCGFSGTSKGRRGPATFRCGSCKGMSTMIPIETQQMVREQVALELEKQHTWITSIAAANIARNMIEKD